MQYLVLSMLGNYHPLLVNALMQLIQSCECQVVESHVLQLGNELNASILLSAHWSGGAKLEHSVAAFQNKHGVKINLVRTHRDHYPEDVCPYHVFITGKNHNTVIPAVTLFFAEQNIAVEKLSSDIAPTRQRGIDILSLTLTVHVPLQLGISELRERFIIFCDRYNLDGMLEMEKK